MNQSLSVVGGFQGLDPGEALLKTFLNPLFFLLNHFYKTRHNGNLQLTSNVPSANQVAWLKLPPLQFLLMTASRSFGSTINRHICSVKPNPQAMVCSSRDTHTHTPNTSLFLFILHADSTSSDSLSICHSLLTALSSVSSSPLCFYVSAQQSRWLML